MLFFNRKKHYYYGKITRPGQVDNQLRRIIAIMGYILEMQVSNTSNNIASIRNCVENTCKTRGRIFASYLNNGLTYISDNTNISKTKLKSMTRKTGKRYRLPVGYSHIIEFIVNFINSNREFLKSLIKEIKSDSNECFECKYNNSCEPNKTCTKCLEFFINGHIQVVLENKLPEKTIETKINSLYTFRDECSNKTQTSISMNS